jgi:hypothetical protein
MFRARLPLSLHIEIAKYCAHTSTPRSQLIYRALTAYLRSEVEHLGGLKALLQEAQGQFLQLEHVLVHEAVTKIELQEQKDAEIALPVQTEREKLYQGTIDLLGTVTKIAGSNELAEKSQAKLDAILVAAVLTRNADMILRSYERGVAESYLRQVREGLERLEQAARASHKEN